MLLDILAKRLVSVQAVPRMISNGGAFTVYTCITIEVKVDFVFHNDNENNMYCT